MWEQACRGYCGGPAEQAGPTNPSADQEQAKPTLDASLVDSAAIFPVAHDHSSQIRWMLIQLLSSQKPRARPMTALL